MSKINRLTHRVLMPQDKEIIRILGCSEREYRDFLRAAEDLSRQEIGSGEIKCFIDPATASFLINLAVGLAFSALSLLLAPSPPKQRQPVRIKTKQVDGQDIVRGDSFGAKSGFDSVQNVVEMGSIIPMVYAKREVVDGDVYGGIRVNTNLIWSQMLSFGGNQMFRGIFLLGQGGAMQVDPRQWGLGDNLLNNYGLDSDGDDSGRVSFYFRPGGGRITTGDHIAGRKPSEDEGATGSDIYRVKNQSNSLTATLTSATAKPSNQTQFGLYEPIGTCLSFRRNPTFRPAVSPELFPFNQGKLSYVACTTDPQGLVERWKDKSSFHNRVEWEGKSGTFGLDRGDVVRLRLARSTDADHKFKKVVESNPVDPQDQKQKAAKGKVDCADVASSISGRQAAYDESLVVGDKYMIGRAIGICIRREDGQFVSDADVEGKSRGNTTWADFRIIKPGVAQSEPIYNQTEDDSPQEGATAHGDEQLADLQAGRSQRVAG